MTNISLSLIESDWETLSRTKSWADLGKCLRALVKIHKNAGQLQKHAQDIQKRVLYLEQNLNKVAPKIRFSIVGDILYARRAIDSTSHAEFGTAFKKDARIHKD